MENNNCNSCNSCYACTSCNSCNSCYACYYCESCDYCTSCDFCNYCDFLNSCNYCNSCYSCKNLKLTEYNYFCWAERYKDENSVQQKPYRIFNTQVTKKEYEQVKKISHPMPLNSDELFHTAFKKMWDTLTKEQKQEYFDIPHFDWEGFTFITGIEEEETIK